jgi:hypothetical protein
MSETIQNPSKGGIQGQGIVITPTVEDYNKALFYILIVALPIGLILLSGIARTLTSHENAWSNFYLGVDLVMAAISMALLSGVDPQSRIITVDPPSSNQIVAFAVKHATAIAVAADFFLLFIAMWIQMSYEKWQKKYPQPTKKQRVAEVVGMLIFHNLVGITAMVFSALVLRY